MSGSLNVRHRQRLQQRFENLMESSWMNHIVTPTNYRHNNGLRVMAVGQRAYMAFDRKRGGTATWRLTTTIALQDH